jgi:hypothetical protein
MTPSATVTMTPPATLTPAANFSVYPVPCNLTSGDAGITFLNLPAGCLLQVYNLNGEIVLKTKNDSPGGKYFWNLSGLSHNRSMAPGIYVYMVTLKGKVLQKGKTAIIR